MRLRGLLRCQSKGACPADLFAGPFSLPQEARQPCLQFFRPPFLAGIIIITKHALSNCFVFTCKMVRNKTASALQDEQAEVLKGSQD